MEDGYMYEGWIWRMSVKMKDGHGAALNISKSFNLGSRKHL